MQKCQYLTNLASCACEADRMIETDPSVRAAGPGDDILRVIEEAFAAEGPAVAALWRDIEASGRVLSSLVADHEGELAGHVGLSPAWVDARRALVDVWVLSPLSVLPDHQRRGIGGALVAAAVEAARGAGAPLLFLEGDPGFYGARGFERASEHGFLAATDRTPDPGFQVVRFAPAEDWMTGRLVYPDVWWRHDAAGLRDPRLAEVERMLR
jgi:putative acetyltransferase